MILGYEIIEVLCLDLWLTWRCLVKGSPLKDFFFFLPESIILGILIAHLCFQTMFHWVDTFNVS